MKPNNRNYAEQLINSGFLKYADSSKVVKLKNEILRSFDIYDEDNFRITHIDAEELAECSFDSFLPGLNRLLDKRGSSISANQLNAKAGSYYAVINGDTVQLYTQKDLEDETYEEKASRHFFQKVNETLATKDIEERFYLLYGSNDLHAILLTEQQLSIIAGYYEDNTKEIPYKP